MATRGGTTAALPQPAQQVLTHGSEWATPADPHRPASAAVMEKQLQRWVNEGGALGRPD